MNYGYKEAETPLLEEGLLGIAIEYLKSHDWYFDEEKFREVWEHEPTLRDIREAHCWTVPQWGEYWRQPYDDNPEHKNYEAPKKRRYESLKDAIWSQILLEQEPADFAVFFAIGPT